MKKWTLCYINQWGDLHEEKFDSLDEIQAHLEQIFKIIGEPFGFRVKYKGTENGKAF